MRLKQLISLLISTAILVGLLSIPAYGSQPIYADATKVISHDSNISLTDISGHWAETSIRQAVQEGWVNGYPGGTFRPNETITRAEFTKMILAATRVTPGCDAVEHMKQCYSRNLAAPSFTDMDQSWLTAQGWTEAALYSGLLIPSDYTEQCFSPDIAIPRREIAVLVDRSLGLVHPATHTQTDSLPFTDGDTISQWRRGYISEAVKAGILTGYPDGTFRPDKTITRAEAVTVVARVKETMEQGVSASLPDDQKITVQILYYGFVQKSIYDYLTSTTAPLDYYGDYQIIDGVIYVDAVELAEKAYLFAHPYETDSRGLWQTDKLAWSFEYGNTEIDFIAGGLEYYVGVPVGLAGNHLLHGRMMAPVYSLKAEPEYYYGPWRADWEESSRTLTIRVWWMWPNYS